MVTLSVSTDNFTTKRELSWWGIQLCYLNFFVLVCHLAFLWFCLGFMQDYGFLAICLFWPSIYFFPALFCQKSTLMDINGCQGKWNNNWCLWISLFSQIILLWDPEMTKCSEKDCYQSLILQTLVHERSSEARELYSCLLIWSISDQCHYRLSLGSFSKLLFFWQL